MDLKHNFDDLIIKNKSIEEGKGCLVCVSKLVVDVEQMKKQINEMTYLTNMRKDKDFLVIDIQDTELRITQLKKSLGVSFSFSANLLCSFRSLTGWPDRA